MVKLDENIFKVNMSTAVGGSSAVPAGFPPKFYRDGYGQKEYMIDGGVIGNNPSLIAWTLKKFGDNSTKGKDIRILSLGAGTNARKDIIKRANEYNQLS
jgi:patatin-like phospholipase/acyl hydrolase